jgi:hypothetical protein
MPCTPPQPLPALFRADGALGVSPFRAFPSRVAEHLSVLFALLPLPPGLLSPLPRPSSYQSAHRTLGNTSTKPPKRSSMLRFVELGGTRPQRTSVNSFGTMRRPTTALSCEGPHQLASGHSLQAAASRPGRQPRRGFRGTADGRRHICPRTWRPVQARLHLQWKRRVNHRLLPPWLPGTRPAHQSRDANRRDTRAEAHRYRRSSGHLLTTTAPTPGKTAPRELHEGTHC